MVAKTVLLFWFGIAGTLWVVIAKRDLNLFGSAAVAVAILSYALRRLDTGAWAGFHQTIVRSPLAIAVGFFGLITSIMVTSMLNGEWDRSQRIPSTCLIMLVGVLHIHHWATGLLSTAWHGKLFYILHLNSQGKGTGLLHRYAGETFCLGTILMATGGVLFVVQPKPLSLWLASSLYGAHLLLLAILCRWSEPTIREFRMCVAMSVAIPLGILMHGGIHGIGEMISKQGIPSAAIFWTQGVDSACH